jgi:hypothetical protein
MVQANAGNNKSVATQRGPLGFGGSRAGVQTSSTVQRETELEKEARLVREAMAEARMLSVDFAISWDPDDTKLCVDTVFGLVDDVRMYAEKRHAKWKTAGKPDVAISKTKEAISALRDENATPASKRQVMTGLFAQLIGNQLLTEGNNRFTYLLLLILSLKFQAQLPLHENILNRDKDAMDPVTGKTIGFDTDRLGRQFASMYDQ